MRGYSQNSGVANFLREYAPDFCWMDWYDLLLFTEEVFPDIAEDSFRGIISYLCKRGEFEVKHDTSGRIQKGSGPKPRLYKRKEREDYDSNRNTKALEKSRT